RAVPVGGLMADPEIPHLAFPLRLVNGQLAQVEQGSIEDVHGCVIALIHTPLGARPLAPDVGVPDPTFTAGVDPDELTGRLERDEPRARVTVTSEPTGPDGAQE